MILFYFIHASENTANQRKQASEKATFQFHLRVGWLVDRMNCYQNLRFIINRDDK